MRSRDAEAERSGPHAHDRAASPIRVGFVVHVMQVAGAEVLVTETIRRLGSGIQPTVFCLDAIGTLGEKLRAEGVPVVCLDRRPGFDWRVAWRLARACRSARIEVLHAHQYTPFFYAAVARMLDWRAPRLILTEHGRHYPDIVSPRRRALNRLVLDRQADAVNAVCAFSAAALNHVDGFAGKRIAVIVNGIDLVRYRPDADKAMARRRLGLDPSRRLIACVARFHPVKDHATLLSAFAAVAAVRADVDLMLVGDGPLRGALERQAADLGITERVRFLGIRGDVPEVLPAADLFTLLSVSEAASLTLLEAMACALPTVVTAVGGNPEIVRAEKEGLLVPRGDVRAATGAFLRLLDDTAMAGRLGAAGRARVEACYQLDDTIGAYGDLYRRLTRGNRDMKHRDSAFSPSCGSVPV